VARQEQAELTRDGLLTHWEVTAAAIVAVGVAVYVAQKADAGDTLDVQR
jgi:hypothetical protein